MHERGRAGTLTAVLGPTNTGKTHLAIERMLGHASGMIGLPLRLLAREVYDKVAARAGAANVALITGEEKIKPAAPRYYVCTVEAMPLEVETEFVAVDEIQLAADPERGHVFTDRLLRARGSHETLLLGAATMQNAINGLLPDANIASRPRLSRLSYAGQKKVSRLPRRSAIVAFSASEVYEIAELVRRQRGGAAVVMGALSPKTRNAQVELYQSGDVDFLVATDAIGMGLNLDVDHVAFASIRKFDGRLTRELTPSELGQIAGRAGRHMNDGTFGVTARVSPFGPELVGALEAHDFEPVRILQWRSRDLDFSSVEVLMQSLQQAPQSGWLARARTVDDVIALENVSQNPQVRALASAPAAIRTLWDVCQIPDYRKISSHDHAELLGRIYCHLMSDSGHIPEDWLAAQVAHSDRTDGDIDTLANRIAHIRTWTFVSHRGEWLADPEHWQARTRDIEERLSDALHERLTLRFVDRRTSVLMKRLRDKDDLFAEIASDGGIYVEDHFVGRLGGFRFTPDTTSADIHGKAARHAAARVLSDELGKRAARLLEAPAEALTLAPNGEILWEGTAVARLSRGESPLAPAVTLITDEHMPAAEEEKLQRHLAAWLENHIATLLKPLVELKSAGEISGLARGIAYQLAENLGVLRRESVAEEIRALDQEARAQLRKYGVRFGAFNIYIPLLLKPAASDLILLLWALHSGDSVGISVDALPELPRQGLTSAPANPDIPDVIYRLAGFQQCGTRVVRIDMLERLADMIRPLIAWRPGKAGEGEGGGESEAPPPGATGNGGFRVQPDMMSIVGCSGEDFAALLRALGFRCERRPLAERHEDGAAPAGGAAATEAPADPQGADRGGEAATQGTATEGGGTAQHEAAPEAEAPQGQDTGAQASAPAEPAFEEIWRPRRKKPAPRREARAGEHPGRARRRARPGKPPRRDARGEAGKPASPRQRTPRKEKAPDPDSPFAALKQLKRDLESRAEDEA